MTRPIQSIDDLQPVVEFYTATMGELPGRLMAALSLLADLEYSESWKQANPDARLAVQLAAAFVADVLKRLVADEPETDWRADMEATLERWRQRNASETP